MEFTKKNRRHGAVKLISFEVQLYKWTWKKPEAKVEEVENSSQ